MTGNVLYGEALEMLQWIPDGYVDCVVTSPPYWGLRDYGVTGQLGAEKTPEEYIARLAQIFSEVRRVLRDAGTCWLNIGDTYCSQGGPQVPQTKWQVKGASDGQNSGKSRSAMLGLKPKDLIGIPWTAAFALRADGWYLRSDIIWHKPNAMPQSVRDRPTTAHEHVFLLTKSPTYYYDWKAVVEPFSDSRQGRDGSKLKRERNRGGRTNGYTKPNGVDPSANGGRNRRSVWTIPTTPYPGAHFAVFPEELARVCILAGCPESGRVLDPFAGSGTTLAVAEELSRDYLGVEMNKKYQPLIEERLKAAEEKRKAL